MFHYFYRSPGISFQPKVLKPTIIMFPHIHITPILLFTVVSSPHFPHHDTFLHNHIPILYFRYTYIIVLYIPILLFTISCLFFL